MTDEPLGSHVLELQVADVVKETDDARSMVFAVPKGVDIPADRLSLVPDCGFFPVPRWVAAEKLKRLTAGAALARVQLR